MESQGQIKKYLTFPFKVLEVFLFKWWNSDLINQESDNDKIHILIRLLVAQEIICVGLKD